MLGVLKNEFIKAFFRREIVAAFVAAVFLPLALCLILTAGEKTDLKQYADISDNYYRNRIDAAERLLENADTDSEQDVSNLADEIRMYNVLQEKNVFSTYTWQYILSELSLAAGFEEEAAVAISADDYVFYYDKMIEMSVSEPQKQLFETLKRLDVYPSYEDYRFLLALRVSDNADTPEDKLLICRIENNIPEVPARGSYGSFVEKSKGIITVVFLIYSSFVASCVFAVDRKNTVPHPSVMVSGTVKTVSGKTSLLAIVLPLTALISYTVVLLAGRAVFSGDAPREAYLSENAEVSVRSFFDMIGKGYTVAQACGAVSAGISGFLSFASRSELSGIAAGGIVSLLYILFIGGGIH